MIVAGPALSPVTLPERLPRLIAELVLLHVPPLTLSVSVIDEPEHTEGRPPMAAGIGFTVTMYMDGQPAAV